MEGKTQVIVSYRWMKKFDPSIKSGRWSEEETNVRAKVKYWIDTQTDMKRNNLEAKMREK